MELDEEVGKVGVGGWGVSRFLKEDIWGMMSGCCGPLTGTDWRGVGGGV